MFKGTEAIVLHFTLEYSVHHNRHSSYALVVTFHNKYEID
jgi:hypothetical protein